MFVRTQRLTLRPAWPEDAPQLAQAIAHESVVRNLSRAPWPYALSDAESFVADSQKGEATRFLIVSHDLPGAPIVGAMGVEAFDGAARELGYWLTPAAWGRGYATEAGRGVIAAMRAIGVRRLSGGYFVDNPASGRVLRKLGFCPTGEMTTTPSRGRGGAAVPTVRLACDLAERDAGDPDPDVDARMAA